MEYAVKFAQVYVPELKKVIGTIVSKTITFLNIFYAMQVTIIRIYSSNVM